MKRQGQLLSGISLGAILAGPVFITTLAFIYLYSQLPKPIAVGASELGLFLLGMCWAVIFGWIVALVPIAAGAILMAAMADRILALRAPILWSATGAVLAFALLRGFGAGNEVLELSSAFIVTGTICALISRRSIRWDAE